MVGGGVHRTPFVAVQALVGWALEEWSWVNGTALRGGTSIRAARGEDVYDILWSLLMLWATLGKEKHDAMRSLKTQLRTIDVMQNGGTPGGLPTGIAGVVGPRVNPKERELRLQSSKQGETDTEEGDTP